MALHVATPGKLRVAPGLNWQGLTLASFISAQLQLNFRWTRAFVSHEVGYLQWVLGQTTQRRGIPSVGAGTHGDTRRRTATHGLRLTCVRSGQPQGPITWLLTNVTVVLPSLAGSTAQVEPGLTALAYRFCNSSLKNCFQTLLSMGSTRRTPTPRTTSKDWCSCCLQGLNTI